MVDQHMQKQ